MLCLAFVCALWSAGVSAIGRDGLLRDLRHTAWVTKDGAPDAQALAQTSDGYLWIGNASGLYRFDGLRFERINLPRDGRLSSSDIYTLYAPPTGGLWLGFTVGNIAFFHDGKWTTYGEEDGLWAGTSIISFAQDDDGRVWAGAPSGMARLEGARWKQVGADFQYPPDTWTQALLVDSEGTLWAAGRSSVRFLPKGEKQFHKAAVQPRKEVRTSEADSVGLAESPGGAVWLLCDKQLRQLASNRNPERRNRSSGFGMLFDRDGSLWTEALDGRVRRFAMAETLPVGAWVSAEGSTDSFGIDDGLSAPGGAGALLEDNEGNVWISSEAGLDRFSESNVARVLPNANQQVPFFASEAVVVAADGGGLWVGGRNFPTFNLDHGNATTDETLGFISAAYRNDAGTVWLAGSKHLWKREAGTFESVVLPKEAGDLEPVGITDDHGGGLWISLLSNGVSRLADGQWTDRGGHFSLPKGPASTMATDADGRIWFAYAAGRVAELDGDTVTNYSGADRLSVGNVTALYGKRGRVWAGGDYGLAYFDGHRFQAVVPEAQGSLENITGIVETTSGDLWLNSSKGIVRLDGEDVRRMVADPSFHIHGDVFDALDGVQGGSARLGPPSAIEGTDGRLYFATSQGLYAVTPANIVRRSRAPIPMIRSVTANDSTFAPTPNLQLPKHTTSVRIDFVGISLTHGERVRYRYKLEDVDADWRDAQERRQAFYTNLEPGPHRFHVIASDGGGSWSVEGATLDFAIAPTFAQTRTFAVLCVLVALATIVALIRFRFRQLAARMRDRFDERIAERERIARELHDTLLQGTQALILQVQEASADLKPESAAHRRLELALDHADEIIAEGRDRILGLRGPSAANADLAGALDQVGKELASERRVDFHVSVQGRQRMLKPVVNDEAYHIGLEALRNAFRHSRADTIGVELAFLDEGIRLRVRDDGAGIDDDVRNAGSKPGHWGLTGMNERARRIGAELTIASSPASGTTIALMIPAASAYVAPRMRWWRSRES